MDTPSRISVRTVSIVLLIFLLILAVASYFFLKSSAQPALYTSIGSAPGGQLYKVDTGLWKRFVPVTAPGQQKGTTVIDEVTYATTTLYLIKSPSGLTSNIFESRGGKPILQVTDSDTFKYDLSYDAASHYLSYLSVVSITPGSAAKDAAESASTVMFATPDTSGKITTEQSITTGASAVAIVPGANIDIVEKSGGIYAYALFGNESQEIATVATGTPFAVSPTGTLALYNFRTQSIELFRVGKGFNGLGYLSSEKTSFVPSALAFDGTKLILGQGGGGMAGKAATGDFFSKFLIPGLQNPVTIPNPGQGLLAAPQILRYE